MNVRYKLSLAVLSLLCISIGVWRGLAVRNPVLDQASCSPGDPLSSCATEPQNGIPAGDLVFGGPELATASIGDGSLAAIRFVPNADPADIAKFLAEHKALLVDGPKTSRMYTIRLPATGKAKEDLIKQMRAQPAIVEFIATVQ
jgi:hypothetical protein